MYLDDSEHVEVHWALAYALDALKATVDDVLVNTGMEPTPELTSKIKRLEALYERFKGGHGGGGSGGGGGI